MSEVFEKLQRCYQSVREKTDFQPQIALILGSGLGDYADSIRIDTLIEYHQISEFPVSTVAGHKGRFVFGYIEDIPVVIMQGRVHFYEGYEMSDVVLPIRLMKMMGAQVLFLTNAAGGLNFDYQAGDFMMITDQIASFVPSPLIGANLEELGPRFCDMTEIYDQDLQEAIRISAREAKIPLQEGVYIQLTGPNYESPTEVKMCRILGGDAVGMSTACEAVAANHMGMKICGISCITNLACGMTEQPLSHQEVQETSNRVAPLFKQLLTSSITTIAKGCEL